jgi:magnesium chelatase subunit D
MASTGVPPLKEWPDGVLVAALLALDGLALGGVHIRGPSGPGRDAWMALVSGLLPDGAALRRCPARIDEERLLGGLDLTASLARGQSVLQRGLLSECDGGGIVFAMAECLPTGLGAQIANVLDQDFVQVARDGIDARLPARVWIILADEGHEDEERAPDALIERCAFALDTRGLGALVDHVPTLSQADLATARATLDAVLPVSDDLLEAICETASAFGIASLRPCLHAVRACQTLAALKGRTTATLEDAQIATRLVLAPKATRLPAPAPEEALDDASSEPEPDTSPDPGDGDESQMPDRSSPEPGDPDASASPSTSSTPPSEMLIETVKASLPEGLLQALLNGKLNQPKARPRDGRGSGEAVTSAKRGRPIGSRRGSLRTGQRLHLIDTLRAAAPWQGLRQSQIPTSSAQRRVLVQPQDVRIRRFVEKRETTIIFAVDASGSTAWQRLAEAKGAVQLMLAHAYQTRSYVALVAFRKETADVVLPATRSLARARRLLGDMVGGGGTPLAKGLETALHLALAERKKGRTPRILLLTDGRGNIARDGTPGRPQAERDALGVALQVRLSGIQAVHIDTSTRPRPDSRALAARMGALYAPLPNPRSNDMALLAGLAN